MYTHMQEDSGFIAVSTNKLIVYGSYSSMMNPSVCVEAVERLGKSDQQLFTQRNVVKQLYIYNRSISERERQVMYRIVCH